MDQDFHYYGTYYAARKGGFDTAQATLIAKAANFIDFFNETTYAAYWDLVSETSKSSQYTSVAHMDYPRYTFQGGLLSTGVAPEDGLWCSYHFTPGNFDDPANTPSRETIHGQALAAVLPAFAKRDTNGGKAELDKYTNEDGSKMYARDLTQGWMLNRPQSALSRQLIADTIRCASDDKRLTAILGYAAGGNLLQADKNNNILERFKLILLGVRAHVIADTWAHQDFCGVSNVLNTYWDVNYDPSSWNPAKWGLGRQSVDYDDGTPGGWRNQVLSSSSKLGIWSSSNLEAVPNNTSYLGHGWMGHMPDFGFVKFRYKPCWSNPSAPVVRDNPHEYHAAWLELVSLFSQAKGNGKINPADQAMQTALTKADAAIQAACKLSGSTTGRSVSAAAWQTQFGDAPATIINVDSEPDANAVLGGLLEATKSITRYGTHTVSLYSDLYLFQIAADYHFHFVKNYLSSKKGYTFTNSWSQQTSALAPEVSTLFSGI